MKTFYIPNKKISEIPDKVVKEIILDEIKGQLFYDNLKEIMRESTILNTYILKNGLPKSFVKRYY